MAKSVFMQKQALILHNTPGKSVFHTLSKEKVLKNLDFSLFPPSFQHFLKNV